MTWNLNDQEFENVMNLPGPRRYEYFVKRTADWEELWTLRGEDGFVLVGDDEGSEYVPVWPHRRYAEACATDEWAGLQPEAIALHDWLEVWIPGMTRDSRSVAVFPLPKGQGVVVSPERLKEDLEGEISLLE